MNGRNWKKKEEGNGMLKKKNGNGTGEHELSKRRGKKMGMNESG
jgi:hypothetical protein